MIDIENKVFSEISTAVKAVYSGCLLTSENLRTPSQFPCVNVREADNTVYTPSRTLDHIENHATVMFEVNVFSNLSSGKKSEAKAIAAIVDDTMAELGFTRTFKSPIPNEDITIYRMIMRYSAVVSEGITEQNKTIYKIYNT